MNVLVTGGAGFIGSHMAEELLGRGHAVAVYDNLLTGRRDNVPAGAAYHEVDIAEPRVLAYGLDLVVHAAASYNDPDEWGRDVRTNVHGAMAVAALGVPTVYFQTVLPPTTSYAISKIAGEQYLRLGGMPLMVFRLANIIGPRNLSGAVPAFYRRLAAGEQCTVARATRDFVHVADLVGYVCDLIAEGEAWGQTLCVASGVERPVQQVHDAVAAALGVVVEPRVVARGPDDIAAMNLEPAADFRPAHTFTAAVRDACAWYAANGVAGAHTHLRIGG